IVKTTGDGLLVEFTSVIDALRCAAEVQRAMAASNAASSTERRIDFRIGINVGDIIAEDGDIFGDGVNVAARLEAWPTPAASASRPARSRTPERASNSLSRRSESIG